MSTLRYLERWKTAGAISAEQHDMLAALVRKDRVSVFVELNALLYAGVVMFIAGVGWTIQTYFASLGDAAVLSSLALLFAGCLFYCFTRSAPYSNDAQESPYFAFDYVLYLGCLSLGVALGLSRIPFSHPEAELGSVSAAVGVRLLCPVLSIRQPPRPLARSFVAGGVVRIAGRRAPLFVRPVVDAASLRPYALAYGGMVAVAGFLLHRAGIKRHFLEAYLHVAANVLLVAVLSGVVDREHEWLYLMALCVLAGLTTVQGIRTRRFAFVAYGILYAYAGISIQVLRDINRDTAVFAYFTVSGAW